MAQISFEPGFFQSAHLFTQNNGGFSHAALGRQDGHMGTQGRFAHFRGQRQNNHRGAEAIAQVILNDQYRPDAPLLRADHRIQIRKIYITAFHADSRSAGDSQRAAAAADQGKHPSLLSEYAKAGKR